MERVKKANLQPAQDGQLKLRQDKAAFMPPAILSEETRSKRSFSKVKNFIAHKVVRPTLILVGVSSPLLAVAK